ncbi:MAG TPA: hypothetical protein VGD58_11800 [Herpetosiphonaceae bacterium]
MEKLDNRYSERRRYASPFISTTLKQVAFWRSFLVMLVYLLLFIEGCSYGALQFYRHVPFIQWFGQQGIWIGVLTVLLGLLVMLSGERHWRTSIHNHWTTSWRYPCICWCLAATAVYVVLSLFVQPTDPWATTLDLRAWLVLLGALVVLLLILVLFSSAYYQPLGIDDQFYLVLYSCLTLAVVYEALILAMWSLDPAGDFGRFLIVVAGGLAVLGSIWLLGPSNRQMLSRQSTGRAIILTLSVFYVAGICCWWSLGWAPSTRMIMLIGASLLGVVWLCLLMGPRYLRAHWRHVGRSIRHDAIRSQFLPTHDFVHPINRMRRWGQRVVTLNNYRWIMFVAFIWGFIASVISVIAGQEKNQIIATFDLSPPTMHFSLYNVFSDLYRISEAFITIGLLNVVTFVGIGFFSALWFRRQRYIFTPFNVSDAPAGDTRSGKSATAADIAARAENGTHASHSTSAAQHMTQQFIAQLEQIGFLLSARRVEDVHGRERFPLSQFITTGGDDEFIAAIQSLVDLDERTKGIPGRLLGALTKALAVINLSGTLRRRDDTELELEVRLTQRFGNQTSIIVPITSPHSTEALLDNTTATRAARHAAVRLLIQSGAVAHLASSEQSLLAFLDGLAASNERNWWRAVASYRRAIQHEESHRGSFGLGRYHLGVALIRQGEFASGIRNLHQAEHADGPLAETQYMLAMTLLHTEWDTLDQKDTEFERIVRYCRRAIQAQRIFPEAYHLLGAAYYHRGKLFERNATRCYGPADEEHTDLFQAKAHAAYLAAETALKKAVQHFDRQIRRLQTHTAGSPVIAQELERLRRDRMTATHHLGDALRSAGFYPLAESYYGDVLAAYPSNIRTIVDISKTLIMGKNWQRADEFLSREAMILPEGKWDADVNFYTGWTFAGGAAELLSMSPSSARMIKRILKINDVWHRIWERRDRSRQEISQQPIELLGLAVSHLDYALYQRPRFAACWSQTNWIEDMTKAFKLFEERIVQSATSPNTATQRPSKKKKKTPIVTRAPRRASGRRAARPQYRGKKLQLFAPSPTIRRKTKRFYQSKLATKSDDNPQIKLIYTDVFLSQLRAWLTWRLDSFDRDNFRTKAFFTEFPLPPKMSDAKTIHQKMRPRHYLALYPHEDFALPYEELRWQRRSLLTLLDQIEETGRLHGIKHAQERLKLSVLALDNWKLATNKLRGIREILKTAEQISFGQRWAYDVYAEISLLTVRLLADAEAYEIAWIVAAYSVHALRWWVDHWGNMYGATDYSYQPRYISPTESLNQWLELSNAENKLDTFRLSPYLSRYHLASMYAWKAYCAHRLGNDDPSYARLLNDNSSMSPDVTALLDEKGLGGWSKLFEDIKPQDQVRRARTILDRAQDEMKEDVRIALDQMPRHPLALLMQSQIARDEMRVDQAISELQRLLEFLRPYDPNALIATWHILEKTQPLPLHPEGSPHEAPAAGRTEQTYPKHLRIRRGLRQHSRVSGQHQFLHVVNAYIVNEQLARVYTTQGKFDLSAQHLMQALTLSPYWDIDADNLLLRLVQHLTRLDRLPDAYAAVGALRARRELLKHNSLSIAKLYQPDAWECIILSRTGRYAESLRTGRSLQRRLDTHLRTLQLEQAKVYTNRLPHRDTFVNTEELFKRMWQTPGRSKRRMTQQRKVRLLPAVIKRRQPTLRLPGLKAYKSYLSLAKWLAEARDVSSSAEHARWQNDEPALIKVLIGLKTDTIDEGLWRPNERENVRGLLPRLDITQHLGWRYVNFLSEEAISIVELWAQVRNNIAFSQIELRLQDTDLAEGAVKPQIEAWSKTFRTTRSEQRATDRLVQRAIDALESLRAHLPARHQDRILRDLAYYYDTKGWMYYRRARLEDMDSSRTYDLLKNAQDALKRATDYDQQSAVIYYHKARVTLTLLERTWQDFMYKYKLSSGDKTARPADAQTTQEEKEKKEKEETNIYLQIDNYLVAVHHYWSLARTHDYNGRFQTRLAWLGLRVEHYRALWKDRYTRLFTDL